MSINKASEPFLFRTQLSLNVLTGLKAANLVQLRDQLRVAPESSIYYHTHNFLQRHQFLVPEPPNDFTHWVTHVLQENRIGERLMAINTVSFRSLNDLRDAILSVLDQFLKKDLPLREAPPGQEFHFMRSILFSLPTSYKVYDLKEFLEALKKVSVHSLYYHIFEARLRTPVGVNDFSVWLEKNLGENELAKKLEKLDPYAHTMEGLRDRIVVLLDKKISEALYAHTA